MNLTRVLFVEDNDDDAELTLRVLLKSRLKGRVTRVRDGVEALEFVFREGQYRGRTGDLPDLILADLNMPRVGGIEMLQTLRSDVSTRHIPVVILTGSSDEKELIESYKLGALSYLIKPVDLPALDEVLDHIERQTHKTPS